MRQSSENSVFTGDLCRSDVAETCGSEREHAQESPAKVPHTGNGPYEICERCGGAGHVVRQPRLIAEHLRERAQIAKCPVCKGDGFLIRD